MYLQIETVTAKRPYRRPVTPRNFQSGEGKVLRFYGRWEDNIGGVANELRKLIVRYHLEDDTVEVGEVHDVNAGRYKAPLFLKRCRLPKVSCQCCQLWIYKNQIQKMLTSCH